MKTKLLKSIIALALLAGTIRMEPAFAGTVITANLPPDTAIINISGTQDGAGSYNGSQSLWYQPFYTGGATQWLEYTIAAGTYNFCVINPADAARLFPALNQAQTNQIFTGWTYNSPWIENYLVFDSAATNSSALPQLIYGAVSSTGYGNAAGAYDAALADGSFDQMRTGPLGRDGPITNAVSFAADETLVFAVPDYILSDNSGGVSVLISPVATQSPPLGIVPGTVTVTLIWPTNAYGFALSQTTNLVAGIWSDVPTVPAIITTNYSVTLTLDTTNRLFRLHKP